MDTTDKQRIITIECIGTAGQLDVNEEDYAVYTLEDAAERARQLIIRAGTPYKSEGYGWSIIKAEIAV